MADALCGPSNALQNFQKHAAVDRTLQQDRLTSRTNPSQTFRSDRYGTAGILDPEFQSFQAGVQPPPTFVNPQIQLTPQQQFHPSSRPFGNIPSSQAAWASDFQRLNISRNSPAPTFQQPIVKAPPKVNWYEDFQRQQTPSPISNSTTTFAQPSTFAYPTNTYQPFAQASTFEPGHIQGKGKAKLEESSQVDETAFEKEFEAHAAQLLQGDLATEFRQETVDGMSSEALEPDILHDQVPIAQPTVITHDLLEQQHEVPNVHSTTDEDLAMAAGQLLDRVSDNTTQKFRESNFLALMGKLRDREVRVDGDKLVDADLGHSASSDTTTNKSTLQSSNAYNHLSNDNLLRNSLEMSRNKSLIDADLSNIADREKERPPLAHQIYTRHVVNDF